MAETLLCLTCRRPLPEGEEYPQFFGQYHVKFDLTNHEHTKEELDVILRYLKAVCDVIPEAMEVDDTTARELGYLARDLTKEAERRAEWLFEAGTSPSPEVWTVLLKGRVVTRKDS